MDSQKTEGDGIIRNLWAQNCVRHGKVFCTMIWGEYTTFHADAMQSYPSCCWVEKMIEMRVAAEDESQSLRLSSWDFFVFRTLQMQAFFVSKAEVYLSNMQIHGTIQRLATDTKHDLHYRTRPLYPRFY